MKRRIISIFFCLLILMGLAIPAYAEENPNTNPINGMIETNLVSFEEPLLPMSSRTESESNNTRSTADLVYAGDTMTGYVSTSSDIDCFKFVPTSSGTLNATMSSIPSGKIFKLCLQDSNGNALVFATNNSVALTSKSFTYNVVAGTTYYIVAYSAGDYSTSDSYVVSVSLSGTSGGSGTTSGENILNVTRYTQEKTKWCWAACVKMNAGYKGYTKTQSQIVEHVHGSAENVTGSMSDVRDALKWISSTTFGAAEYKNITNDRYQSNIIDHIDDDKPVHVACMPSTGVGHSYLIKGYKNDGNTLVLVDPWSNQSVIEVSKNNFLTNGFYCYAVGKNVTGLSSIVY